MKREYLIGCRFYLNKSSWNTTLQFAVDHGLKETANALVATKFSEFIKLSKYINAETNSTMSESNEQFSAFY